MKKKDDHINPSAISNKLAVASDPPFIQVSAQDLLFKTRDVISLRNIKFSIFYMKNNCLFTKKSEKLRWCKTAQMFSESKYVSSFDFLSTVKPVLRGHPRE